MQIEPNTSPNTYSAAAIVLVGPTGVGKSALAMELAHATQGEIVSVDSRQIYRHMDIGTAKPTAAERAAVPHHLLDIAEPTETFSAGRFAAAARVVIAELQQRRRTAIVVGGSGLYLQALMDGLVDEAPLHDSTAAAADRRQHWRQRLAHEGALALWEQLGRTDPAAQRTIEPTDEVRILRALELSAAGDSRALRWQRQRIPGISLRGPLVCLTRPRASLYDNIDRRTRHMLAAGWLHEVEHLLGLGLGEAPGLATLGYLELKAHIDGAMDLAAAETTIQRRTRQFAKRQMTWFRRDRRLRWLDLDRLGIAGARRRIIAQFEQSVGRCPR